MNPGAAAFALNMQKIDLPAPETPKNNGCGCQTTRSAVPSSAIR